MRKEVKLVLIKYPKTTGDGYEYVIKRLDNNDILRLPANAELDLED